MTKVFSWKGNFGQSKVLEDNVPVPAVRQVKLAGNSIIFHLCILFLC